MLVWVHGGGFIGGSGSDHDPERLVTCGDLVVITVNYRLGIFGSLTHPGLGREGSFALQDQQVALRWVQANIAAFGGDPGNVTLAGLSAGALSICSQLASPSAAGLFHKAIIANGSCLTNFPAGALHPALPALTN
ncbi:MAG: carboxylesterase family protein [Pseudonocardiaceae bacterium]